MLFQWSTRSMCGTPRASEETTVFCREMEEADPEPSAAVPAPTAQEPVVIVINDSRDEEKKGENDAPVELWPPASFFLDNQNAMRMPMCPPARLFRYGRRRRGLALADNEDVDTAHPSAPHQNGAPEQSEHVDPVGRRDTTNTTTPQAGQTKEPTVSGELTAPTNEAAVQRQSNEELQCTTDGASRDVDLCDLAPSTLTNTVRGVTFAEEVATTRMIPRQNKGRKVADRKKRTRGRDGDPNISAPADDVPVEEDADFEDEQPVIPKRRRGGGLALPADEEDADGEEDADLEDPQRTAPDTDRTINLRELFQRDALERSPALVHLHPPSIRDPRNHTARIPMPDIPAFIAAPWPSDVMHLSDTFNPRNIAFPRMYRPGKCKCQLKKRGDCWHKTCENAKDGIFCDAVACPWGGICAKGTRQAACVRLVRIRGTEDLAIQAIDRINEGVVIGEYLGELTFEPRDRALRIANEGYRMHFHYDPDAWGDMEVCVNALEMGSLMRFVNHSCTPNAKFNEVGNGRYRTITVVTMRTVYLGEEITVDYGSECWFTCRCEKCAAREADGNEDEEEKGDEV